MNRTAIEKMRAMVLFFDRCNETRNDRFTSLGTLESAYDVCRASDYDVDADELDSADVSRVIAVSRVSDPSTRALHVHKAAGKLDARLKKAGW